MLTPLWLTLKVAFLATLFAGAAGIALGWWMARRRFPGHAWVDAALVLLREAGDRVEEAHVRNSVAILQHRRGEPDAAVVSFGAALTLFQEVGDERSAARVLGNLGYLHLSAGRHAAGR